MTGPALEGLHVDAGYRSRRAGDRVVVPDANVTIARGELVCLLGPNGVGKSTLLRTLAGMQAPLGGEVMVDGDPLDGLDRAERARRLAVVLTAPPDLGLLTAVELVSLGRYPHTGWTGRLSRRDQDVIAWALEATRTTRFAHRPVSELSDGERQRVMIARALAQQPSIVLLDEPTAFLDVPGRVELAGLLHRLAAEEGVAVLVSTHDLQLALRTADTVWVLDGRGVLHVGAPEDVVLDGVIGRTFDTEDVAFDPDSAEFAPLRPASGAITVAGEDLRSRWLARAVVRAGLVPASVPVGRTVTWDAGSVIRLLDEDGAVVATFANVAELVSHLRAEDRREVLARTPSADDAGDAVAARTGREELAE